MKKILLFGMALLAMVSCEKYDDSEVWEAIKSLQADTVKEESTSNVIPVIPIEKGAIKAAFSIGENKQVYFSQGNLQYQASTGVWRFATNQWEAIGEGNANIAPDYNGWIDLFCWGTSGWNSGANEYVPYATSSNILDYCSKSLTDSYSNADWGVYNKIVNGGNQTGLWRVLTKNEWDYLCKNRPDAANRCGIASVNGVNGMVILPDNWILPDGLSFTGGVASTDAIENFQTINNYNLFQWTQMEKNGAVFLPSTGYRHGLEIRNVEAVGYYYSSSWSFEGYVYSMHFASDKIIINDYRCDYGRSVRLVQDVK